MSLGSAHHWHGMAHWRCPSGLKELMLLSVVPSRPGPGPGVRTGMKHVKGIEYDGVGWLMTSSGCGWMEFIALTRATDCLKKRNLKRAVAKQEEGIQAIISCTCLAFPALQLVTAGLQPGQLCTV